MSFFSFVKEKESVLLSDKCYSGEFNQHVYLKRAADDGSGRPKFYINIFSNINGELVKQGYLYFYVDYKMKACDFIGVNVSEEYRNLNIGSFLVATWIDLCMNCGYDFLGVNPKQRKPFLVYLLKTYGFGILDTSLYRVRDDVIYICKGIEKGDKRKLLLFKDLKHESTFKGTNVFKSDNYEIVHSRDGVILLDKVIVPFQNRKFNGAEYLLFNTDIAEEKCKKVISRHKR